MSAFDSLPEPVRRWLAEASLPWNPRSVARVWAKMIRKQRGDVQAALNAMQAIEGRLLTRDAPKVWGNGYPARSGNRSMSIDHFGPLL